MQSLFQPGDERNWEKVAHFQLYTEVATSVVADYMREGEEGGVRGEGGGRKEEGGRGGSESKFHFFFTFGQLCFAYCDVS